jgi:hypothetical protein
MSDRHRKIWTIEELVALQDPGNHWLVSKMIPRIGRTMVWGDGGTFKTTAMLDLAVACASRGSFLQHYPVEVFGPVLVITTEGDIYSARRRLMSHIRAREQSHLPESGIRTRPPLPTLEDIPLYFGHRPYDFANKNDVVEFEEELKEIRPVLVMLDPLDSFVEGDENSAHQTKPFRRELDRLVDQYEFSLIIIHHAGKEQEGKPVSARGSSAWRGWVDAHIYFKQMSLDIDGTTYPYFDVFSHKQRDGASNQRVCAALPIFDEERNMISFSPIEPNAPSSTAALSEAALRILGVLRKYDPTYLTQTELQNETALSHARLKDALMSLRKDGWIADDVEVLRNTNADGSRQRRVKAWRAVSKITLVDQAAAILRATQAYEGSIEEAWDLLGGNPDDARSELHEPDTSFGGGLP